MNLEFDPKDLAGAASFSLSAFTNPDKAARAVVRGYIDGAEPDIKATMPIIKSLATCFKNSLHPDTKKALCATLHDPSLITSAAEKGGFDKGLQYFEKTNQESPLYIFARVLRGMSPDLFSFFQQLFPMEENFGGSLS